MGDCDRFPSEVGSITGGDSGEKTVEVDMEDVSSRARLLRLYFFRGRSGFGEGLKFGTKLSFPCWCCSQLVRRG